jgi:hypothetical protein
MFVNILKASLPMFATPEDSFGASPTFENLRTLEFAAWEG